MAGKVKSSLVDRLKAARSRVLLSAPGIDDQVEVRSMTVAQRREFAALSTGLRKAGEDGLEQAERLTFILAAWCAFDPADGTRLFSGPDDPAFDEIDAGFKDLIATTAMEVSGLDVGAAAASKNASRASTGSSSGSPATSEA